MTARLRAEEIHLIERYAECALNDADAVGVFPTPIDDVAAAVGIRDIADIVDLPDLPELEKPSVLKKLLGALHREERAVWVDHDQPHYRVHWTKSHETGHRILPWQESLAYLDDDERLRFDTTEAFELEANYAAAHLVFQGARFFERALDYQTSIHTPLALAGEVGASAHATIRYFCERHPEQPVAVAITGAMITSAGRLPIYHTLESPVFRRRYGPLAAQLPSDRWLPVSEGLGNGQLAEAVRDARLSRTSEFEFPLRSRRGAQHPMRTEVFFNRRNFFLMLRPRGLRLGRRIKAA